MGKKTILWDFDGVILNSNEVRDQGFEKVLSNFPSIKVNQLMDYHHANGGLSRYHKFKYFYESILKEELSNEKLSELCSSFTEIMRELLVNPQLLNAEVVDFIRRSFINIDMHVVSGSDENELVYLCKNLGISDCFISISGSPTAKNELVLRLLEKYKYDKADCLLIGDSINDFEAAMVNGIKFCGYNNPKLIDVGGIYVYDINEVNNYLK